MRSVRTVRKSWLVAGSALVALVVAGAIQAAVGGGSVTPAISQDSVATSGVADVAGGSGGSATAGKTEAAVPAPALPPDGGTTAVVPGSPRVVRTADLRVKVAKGAFGSAFDRVAALAAANGGFVSSSSTASNDDDVRSGDLTVRVPADRFDTVRQSLVDLGQVESQSIRGEDVSGQLVDFDARLKSLQAQEDSLRVLVGQAKAVGEVLQVQSSLFTVRQQIEQLKAQKANLEQATTLATLQVSLFEPGAAAVVRPAGDDRSLAHSARQAVDGMLAVVGGMIVVLGYLVPVAVLGLLGWGGARVLRRRPVRQAPAV
jgi:uncharacterized protein DUF4349